MTRQQRLTLVATILGSTVVFLDTTVVNVALPAIEEDLDTGLAGQQWVLEAYLLALVAFLLVGGSLGDRYGRRRLFVIGLTGFGATSILCAIAPTSEVLIAARALQGVAGALLVPGSLAIIAATFEGEARGRAVGIWTAWAGIATLVGPAGGGLLVEVDWRLIFWINLPLIAGTLLITRSAVAESSDPEATRGIDGVGILLSAVGLGGPVFALIEQPTYGFGDPLVAIPLVVGIVSLAAFVWWESRARSPMLPLELFRSRNFSVVNGATLCVYAALYGAIFFVTLFLQQVAGYTAFEAGAATTPVTLLMFALSSRFGALAARIGPRLVMGAGPLIAAVGLVLMSRIDADADYVSSVLPALIPYGLGLAMTVAPLTTTVLDSVEERHVGRRLRGQQRRRAGRRAARDRRAGRGDLGPVLLRVGRRAGRSAAARRGVRGHRGGQGAAAVRRRRERRSPARRRRAGRRGYRLVRVGVRRRHAHRRGADGARRRGRPDRGA